MGEHTFLAFDLGATSGRAVIGNLAGGKLTMEGIHRFPNSILEKEGKYYWDIHALFNELKRALIICTERGIEPQSNAVYDVAPAPNREDLKDMIRTAARKLNSYGVTSSQTDDYSSFANVHWQEINAAYEELAAAGELTVRVCQQSNFTNLEELKDCMCP